MKILMTLLLFSTIAHANEQEALKTMKTLGMNLKKELKAAMKKSPVNAVEVCNTKANEITKAAAQNGIIVGRVSTKNRNPNNTPKEWMKPYIEKFHSGKINKPYVVVSLKDKTGVLKPIKTEAVCLNCHGPRLIKPVANKIKELYPKDKATGYKIGEIRGFFWAEY